MLTYYSSSPKSAFWCHGFFFRAPPVVLTRRAPTTCNFTSVLSCAISNVLGSLDCCVKYTLMKSARTKAARERYRLASNRRSSTKNPGPIGLGLEVPQITEPARYLTNVSDRVPNPKGSGTAPQSGATAVLPTRCY